MQMFALDTFGKCIKISASLCLFFFLFAFVTLRFDFLKLNLTKNNKMVIMLTVKESSESKSMPVHFPGLLKFRYFSCMLFNRTLKIKILSPSKS